ncbi:hypothetical protein FMM08_19740 [Quadrisphaera setariae]|uniref:N-acetylmuramoyl-L-alanine amidase n=1 Tax=Quadrisphaera setariae TaxID=2593304 RepID=A0A5C8Z570_9ACTN|nr:hypothetical protein FMM08_19740 [Quadrisphaera setariae]
MATDDEPRGEPRRRRVTVSDPGASAGAIRRRAFLTGAGVLGGTVILAACAGEGRVRLGAEAQVDGQLPRAGGTGQVRLIAAEAVSPSQMQMQVPQTQVQQIDVQDMTASRVAGSSGLAATVRADVGGKWVSATHEVRSFRLLGMTWPAAARQGAQLVLAVRVRSGGQWSAWQVLEVMETAPARSEASSAQVREGTEPLAVASSDAVQVRVSSETVAAPAGLRLELIDPGESTAHGTAEGTADGTARVAPTTFTNQPAIVTRAQWGADESYRNDVPHYNATIKAAVIHHTAGSNDYTSPAEAQGEVRSVYAYHTRSLGWDDIGYHFLVDRFGTIYEGRAGGVDRPVRGAHAGGFNTDTFGVSVLGNYETAAATPAIVDSVARVTAWKLGLHGVDPNATTQLVSEGGGTSRYGAGTVVDVATIIGHRDVGATACPGEHLYAQMDQIRSTVSSYLDADVDPEVTRLAGGDRYETSAAQAREIYPDSRTVLIVAGEDDHLVDGLVAAPLAVQRQAPILLSRRDHLPDVVAREVQRRAANTAYLIGGASSLGEGVEQALRACGVTQLVRIAGTDRYDTAAQVALKMAEAGTDDVAVLASGETEHMIDALAVGGPAGLTARPILLTRAGGTPQVTLDALQRLKPKSLVVVGGSASVSPHSAAAALAKVGLTTKSLVRIAGPDRYSTATAIASAWSGKTGTHTIIIASGEQANVADAISAGAHGRLTLLVPRGDLPGATVQWLRSRAISQVIVVGGASAVSNSTVTQIMDALKGKQVRSV